MSTIPSDFAAPLAEVTARLARLRRSVKLWAAIDGLARFLSLLLVLILLDFVLDWTFHFDRSQRVIIWLLVSAALASASYHWLLTPLSRPLSDVSLAWELERRYSSLGQSLISALQFAKQPPVRRLGVSARLLNRALAEAAQRSAGIDFDRVVAPSTSRRALAWLSAMVALLAILAASSFFASPIPIWFHRNVFLRDLKWPQNTYLLIHELRPDGSVVFPRGGDWTQIVSVRENSRLVPTFVEMEIKDPTGHSLRRLEPAGKGQFALRFSRVTDPFQFRVRGGDDLSPWVRVDLADPPAILSHQLRITPPSYVGLSDEGEPAATGPTAVLPGSSLHFQATANKPLARAALTAHGRLLTPSSPADVHRSFPLLTEPGSQLHAVIPAADLLIGRYQIELRDEFGFAERNPLTFDLRERVDQPPRVTLHLLTSRGLVTARAVVPFACTASDDFGLSSLQARLRWQSSAGDSGGEQTMDLRSVAGQALVPVGQPATAATLEVTLELDLTQLEGLAAAADLQISISAADNNNHNGPGIGTSLAAVLRVVSDDEMRSELLRREKELRQQLEQAIRLLDQLAVEVKVMATKTPQAPDFTSELDRLHREQLDLIRNLQAIAERYALVGREVASNRLDDSQQTFQSRVNGRIVQPLHQVGGELLPVALNELRLARVLHSDSDPQSHLTAAIGHQTAASELLREILRHMIQSENYQEAVQMLAEINRAQAELTEQTTRAREEKVRRLLDEAP